MYSNTSLPIREGIASSHQVALASFSQTGTWFDGVAREKILKEFRFADSGDCELCQKQKAALSPYTHNGTHDSVTDLPEVILDVIHRIATDSGRLTESWFKSVLAKGLLPEEYVEILGCVATAIVLDTFAVGVGVSQSTPEGTPETTEPTRTKNPGVVKEDAWVPVSERSLELGPSGLPTVPNIARAMGLVPSAIMQFFPVMRSHYGLDQLTSELSRPQTELIAARTSSYNDCFY